MITRRRLIAGGTALVLLAACGDDENTSDNNNDNNNDSNNNDNPSTPAFPVTLQTTLGAVEIETKPERIVSLGTPDAAIALGTIPVAIPRSADDPSGIHPWLQDTYADSDVELLDMTAGIPFDQVTALAPDLIIATDIVVQPADYERLSQIAPVVTYQSPDPLIDNPWQDQTRLVGAAVGLADEAKAMVKDMDERITQVETDHPRWNDMSFTLSNFDAGSFGAIIDPDDGGFELLELLGFVISPALAEIADGENITLGPDKVAVLDADLVVVLCPDEAVDALMAVSGFAALPAVKDGRYLTVPPVLAYAMRVPGIVNVPWVLDDVLGDIEAIIPT